MSDLNHYVVELIDATYHHTPDEGENAHRIGIPIVDGPFETFEEAERQANAPGRGYSPGFAPVSIPEDEVPEDWDE